MLFDKTTSIYRGAEPTQIPDGLDIYDFMFSWRGAEGATPRPDPTASTWLIDAKDGRTLDFQGAKDRTDAVARAWHSLGVGAGDAVCIFSSNEVSLARRQGCAIRSRRNTVPRYLKGVSLLWEGAGEACRADLVDLGDS